MKKHMKADGMFARAWKKITGDTDEDFDYEAAEPESMWQTMTRTILGGVIIFAALIAMGLTIELIIELMTP